MEASLFTTDNFNIEVLNMIFNIGCGTPPRPLFNITIDGVTYTFDGQNPVSVSDKLLIEVKNIHDWRMKILPSTSVSLSVVYFNPNLTMDVGLVGRGGNGGTWTASGDGHTGGGGGGGGEIKTVLSQTFTTGQTYTLNTSGSTSITGSGLSLTCNNGGVGGCGGPDKAPGGSSGGNSGKGGNGGYRNGASGEYGHKGYGGSAGGYVFDSTFDSTRYGSGGSGGSAWGLGWGPGANGYGNPGSGGNGHGDGVAYSDDYHAGWDGIIWIKSSTW